ncbi:conserved hypothetical protein [Perkinsus marinus ATCC 50983]|uniref:Mitochondrial processing peptidase beta subunit n=1 Tax=Perkinsus marinus (strain ATCC 50983 / TXsc) TaxID=423536 RepID=C5KZ72_PERM5|nr:conserved hypothetical protein [Perkinsus marinus ATCC 50983]EER10222.1 conserved hypothetical protein [Perkinsus marinus ATCC 50983]|eukprot:XP_002778427.1 conserved hypothetical protein [Perkinsus marinus ATCC 50983]
MLVQKSVPYLSHSLAVHPAAAALARTGRRGFLDRRMISNMSASLGGALFNAPPTKVTTLPNGLRVATQHTFTESATVGVWIDAGSRYETKETNGTAHFLEHLAFKGTQRRSRIQLEREVEDIGAHLNAYTSREQTVYYAKTRRECVGQGLDILSDILQHSKLERRAIEEERGVILREMEEVNKSLEEVIYDQLHIACFREDPLGVTLDVIQVCWRNICSLSSAELRSFLYSVGGIYVRFTHVVDDEHIFLRWCIYTNLGRSVRKPMRIPSEFLHVTDALGAAGHVAVAFEGVPWTSPDCITFMLMQQIVGGYNSAFQGRNGVNFVVDGVVGGDRVDTAYAVGELVYTGYSFTAFNTCYKDTGLFGFYVASPEQAVNRAIDELMCSINCLSYSVTEDDLERAKKQLLTTLFIGLDDTTGGCMCSNVEHRLGQTSIIDIFL